MEGISRMAGGGVLPVSLAGKEYRLRTRILRHLAEIENRIAGKRANPIDRVYAAVAELPAERQERELDRLMPLAIKEAAALRFVTTQDIVEFGRTLDGKAFNFWLSSRDEHPELSEYRAVLDLFEDVGWDHLIRLDALLDAANVTEDVALKNSAGPTETETAAKPDASLGPGSTDGSPNATAGAPVPSAN